MPIGCARCNAVRPMRPRAQKPSRVPKTQACRVIFCKSPRPASHGALPSVSRVCLPCPGRRGRRGLSRPRGERQPAEKFHCAPRARSFGGGRARRSPPGLDCRGLPVYCGVCSPPVTLASQRRESSARSRHHLLWCRAGLRRARVPRAAPHVRHDAGASAPRSITPKKTKCRRPVARSASSRRVTCGAVVLAYVPDDESPMAF